jgi:hypothetical protein
MIFEPSYFGTGCAVGQTLGIDQGRQEPAR